MVRRTVCRSNKLRTMEICRRNVHIASSPQGMNANKAMHRSRGFGVFKMETFLAATSVIADVRPGEMRDRR